ncbi:Fc.00g025110.m01.CDS01 [Cosmosporella sp. VM-42]
MVETERRRRRPAVRRKIRCNRESPCSNCVRSRSESCIYDNNYASQAPQHNTQGQRSEPILSHEFREPLPVVGTSSIEKAPVAPTLLNSSVHTSRPTSTLASQQSIPDVESIKGQIKQLEEQLARLTPRSSLSPSSPVYSDIETATSRLGGVIHMHRESRLFGQLDCISRSISHKGRLFGQSHWINVFPLFQQMFERIEPKLLGESSKAICALQRCKSLAKAIKSQRSPPWPSPPTSELPPKDVADELVNCYLRTTETIYRILHIPTFRKNYDAVWVSGTEPEMAFLIQLKLVLALGATTYDEKFSLRVSAIRWVYEAQTWISEPKFKSRLGIQFVQTQILLLLAQETVAVGGDPIWISAGALLRRAVHMGLHRDPTRLPKMPKFVAEMRRRLWNTILELSLQSSMSSGGPPLLSPNDFDVEPPGNFDDHQLTSEDPMPKPDNIFTQASMSIVLRKTFLIRLAVTKFLNDHDSHGTYEETLRLDAELRASYKGLCRTLQACKAGPGPSPSRFEMRAVDFIMHRYLSALHAPFFGPALNETAYAFSRAVVIETSLKIWSSVYPSTSKMTSGLSSTDRDDLPRFTHCASGFFRIVAMQAMLFIAAELTTIMQEEQSLDPVSLRPDLQCVIENCKTWSLRCIEAGETNIKGYLLVCVIAAGIEGLMQSLGKDEVPELLVKAAEIAGETCLPMLEEMLAQLRCEGPSEGLREIALNMNEEVVEDWDFMMSDTLFNPGDTGLMTWMLYNETAQGAMLP